MGSSGPLIVRSRKGPAGHVHRHLTGLVSSAGALDVDAQLDAAHCVTRGTMHRCPVHGTVCRWNLSIVGLWCGRLAGGFGP